MLRARFMNNQARYSRTGQPVAQCHDAVRELERRFSRVAVESAPTPSAEPSPTGGQSVEDLRVLIVSRVVMRYNIRMKHSRPRDLPRSLRTAR